MNGKSVQVTSHESGVTYTAGKHLGGTETFTLYECLSSGGSASSTDAGKCCILKIAAAPEHNSILDREAFVLKKMLDEAARLEAAFLEAKPGTEMRMNYQFAFPNLVETFVSEEQSVRRVLILGFCCIAKQLSDLVPLSHLESRERVRVDHRTSAWILGKLLKLLVMTHGIGILNNWVVCDNILINREQHFVALFDWSRATINREFSHQHGGQEEIAKLAQAVTRALGGDPRTGKLPADPDSSDEYTEIVRRFALGKEGDAQKAHREFYALVDRLWQHEFYPFTTHPMG